MISNKKLRDALSGEIAAMEILMGEQNPGSKEKISKFQITYQEQQQRIGLIMSAEVPNRACSYTGYSPGDLGYESVPKAMKDIREYLWGERGLSQSNISVLSDCFLIV